MAAVATALVLASVLAFIAIYDLYVALTSDYRSTVSYVCMQAALAYPIIPFLVGVLMGHLFWPQAPHGAVQIPHDLHGPQVSFPEGGRDTPTWTGAEWVGPNRPGLPSRPDG